MLHLSTTDPAVATKYDTVEESEFWGDDEHGLGEGDDAIGPKLDE